MSKERRSTPIAELMRTVGHGDLRWVTVLAYIIFGLSVAFFVMIMVIALT
jgi:cell division septal protein FtsQ